MWVKFGMEEGTFNAVNTREQGKEGGRNRGSEEKGHAAEMNVCCCNGKLLMIAVLYTVLWPLLCNNNVFNVLIIELWYFT